MNPIRGRHLKKYLLLGLLFCSSAAWTATTPLPFFDSKDLTPYWLTDKSASTRQPIVMTAFRVMDQDGKSVTEHTLKKQMTLVNFFFTACPRICPTMMQTLRVFQKNLRPGAVQIYSFSVTPQKDSPERLREYARKHGISTRHWSLLTGDEKEIFKIGKDTLKADGAVGAPKQRKDFIHTTNVYLLDRDLYLRGIYDTTDEKAMKFLAKDIATLRADSELPKPAPGPSL